VRAAVFFAVLFAVFFAVFATIPSCPQNVSAVYPVVRGTGLGAAAALRYPLVD
jgi:hypothetical protein